MARMGESSLLGRPLQMRRSPPGTPSISSPTGKPSSAIRRPSESATALPVGGFVAFRACLASSSERPHFLQNCESSSFSVPQAGQKIIGMLLRGWEFRLPRRTLVLHHDNNAKKHDFESCSRHTYEERMVHSSRSIVPGAAPSLEDARADACGYRHRHGNTYRGAER